jgi:hypothetical protein
VKPTLATEQDERHFYWSKQSEALKSAQVERRHGNEASERNWMFKARLWAMAEEVFLDEPLDQAA